MSVNENMEMIRVKLLAAAKALDGYIGADDVLIGVKAIIVDASEDINKILEILEKDNGN
jgi:hypothetical protein